MDDVGRALMIPSPSQTRSPRGQARLRKNPARHQPPLTLRPATDHDRETIYRLRHEIFARELGQYPVNESGRLTDSLDAFNLYFVACEGHKIVGFVSVTPPGGPSYSLDTYVKRDALPFPIDDRVYEIRLLGVLAPYRRGLLALALMYAAFRWIVAHGGNRIIAIGRREILTIHMKLGLSL